MILAYPLLRISGFSSIITTIHSSVRHGVVHGARREQYDPERTYSASSPDRPCSPLSRWVESLTLSTSPPYYHREAVSGDKIAALMAFLCLAVALAPPVIPIETAMSEQKLMAVLVFSPTFSDRSGEWRDFEP
ncbi:MAG: hypothetical protein M5U01_07160 [Ardenticatenaceae bacterium]|nr:hypothetical protein [Ardenticatenaceae bacterium]